MPLDLYLRSRFLLFSFFLVVLVPSFSQEILDKHIVFKGEKGMRTIEAMEKISEENNFFLSFQSAAVPVESPLPMDQFEGEIGLFLTQVLGNQYEYKEIPGYIIIRYAPRTLDVETAIEIKANQVFVKGQVRDFESRENVSFASIYEKNQMVSTLSGEEGYFELKLGKQNASFWITLSKENYKDTTFVLLPTVDINYKSLRSRLKFSPDGSAASEIEQSFMGRLLIGFRQRMQRINLGGFFGENPYQISLIPGLSSQGMFSSQMINRFSLNLIGGYSAGTGGFETAGIFNINQMDVKGFQSAGIFNIVGGKVIGFQVAGIYNLVYKKMNGFQVAGIYNYVKENTTGVQVAGIYNRTDSTSTHQIAGLRNKSHISKGIQIAGLSNHAIHRAGTFQLAGLVNHTEGPVEYQVAGLINRAGVVNGFQLGMVNFADESDYSFGLLNFIKNGKKSIGLGLDESPVAQLTFRSGGKLWYGVFGIGIRPNPTETSFDLGLGTYLLEKNNFSLDLELVNRITTDFRNYSNPTYSFRILNAFRLIQNTHVFLGPSLSFTILAPFSESRIPGKIIWQNSFNNRNYGLFGGMVGGLQYRF